MVNLMLSWRNENTFNWSPKTNGNMRVTQIGTEGMERVIQHACAENCHQLHFRTKYKYKTVPRFRTPSYLTGSAVSCAQSELENHVDGSKIRLTLRRFRQKLPKAQSSAFVPFAVDCAKLLFDLPNMTHSRARQVMHANGTMFKCAVRTSAVDLRSVDAATSHL